MLKNKKFIYTITILPIIIIFFLFGWFFVTIFEGEKPVINLKPLPDYLSGKQKFVLNIKDMERGLKKIRVIVNKEGRDLVVFEKKFLFKGILNRHGIHQYTKELSIDPSALNLPQGRVDLNISVWDYSRRGGGDGNMAIAHHRMIVDTVPPAIRPINRLNNISRGGGCLVIYQTSSDAIESGVFIDDLFFPGFPAGTESRQGIHLCYFALPYNAGLKPSIYLWARDRAGNRSTNGFYCHIRRKRFRKERLNIADSFLRRTLPYFSFYTLDPEASDIDKYIKINNDLRKKNNKTLFGLTEKTSPEKLWKGRWLRLRNSATMARFADRRSYYYKGKKIDQQDHLGVDLASLANSPVQAANNGKVVFSERLGIYGLTVVIDHGQGLASIYGHLNKIDVKTGQEVNKGDIIGLTGQTGLAGGDHLHFAVMVGRVFVNPREWWDAHWIKDNITRKLKLIKK